MCKKKACQTFCFLFRSYTGHGSFFMLRNLVSQLEGVTADSCRAVCLKGSFVLFLSAERQKPERSSIAFASLWSFVGR